MLIKALLTLLILLNTANQPIDLASNEDLGDYPRVNEYSRSLGVEITGQSGIVLDWEIDRVLWEKDQTEVLPIASITKLITGLVILEGDINNDQVVTIQKQDQRAEGGNRHLYLGESLTVLDLLHSAFMASDNEAIMALIRSSGYNEESFVLKANQWLENNGFEHTVMVEPTGLRAGNKSTAREIARISKLAFSNDTLYEILKKENYQFQIKNSGRAVNINNTNKLLNGDFGVILGKTGYIEEAGYCLTTLSSDNADNKLITVVLGSDSIENRFQDTKAIIYWVRNNFIWK